MSYFSSHSFRVLGAFLLCTVSWGALAQTASDEPKFPALGSSYLKTGDFIGPDHVKRITPGSNKDQVRLELGNPHFSEGIFAVHEWDYAFNFYTGKGNEFVTCQYKVRFNSDNVVVSTDWKSPECEAYVHPVAAKVVPVVVAPVELRAPRRIVLGADGLFAFGRSGLNDLSPVGRDKLSALATELKGVRLSSVVVTGHTDRVGSTASNQALSEARAATVSAYLVQQGLNGQLVRANGAGESKPVVQCAGEHVTPALISCLQPNRRVDVEVTGER